MSIEFRATAALAHGLGLQVIPLPRTLRHPRRRYCLWVAGGSGGPLHGVSLPAVVDWLERALPQDETLFTDEPGQ